MLLSKYFLPTRKDVSSELTLASHKLMVKAGMIKQVASGLYAFLPLGLKVLRKIENIVREGLNEEGFNEILMPTIQPASLWKESGRYNGYGAEMLKFKDRHNAELLYGPTAEEVITFLVKNEIKSYKDLPLVLYNIQWKFRDEIRPRFALMRAREFLMMDSYSFDKTEEGAIENYNKHYDAYLKIFARLGLTAIPMQADTGEIGGDLSHEFHIIAEAGESEIVYEENLENLIEKIKAGEKFENLRNEIGKFYAATDEKHLEKYMESGGQGYNYEALNEGEDFSENEFTLKSGEKTIISKEFFAKLSAFKERLKFTPKFENETEKKTINGKKLIIKRGIEVGHNFYFNTKYSTSMSLTVQGADGKPFNPLMGSYGIGVGRLMAAFIEANHDENGIIWNENITPFDCYIVDLTKTEEAKTFAKEVYENLKKQGKDVLFDDTTDGAGVKFARSDLIGIPTRITISEKLFVERKIEIKNRKTGVVTIESL